MGGNLSTVASYHSNLTLKPASLPFKPPTVGGLRGKRCMEVRRTSCSLLLDLEQADGSAI